MNGNEGTPLLCVECYRLNEEGRPIRDNKAEVIYEGKSLCRAHFEKMSGLDEMERQRGDHHGRSK